MTGLWEGYEVPTGHPSDGLLELTGWFGKRFDGPESVHPLVFRGQKDVFSVDPRWVGPFWDIAPRTRWLRPLMRGLRPLVSTARPCARLRTVAFRGSATAAMVYDHLPIIDVFRRLGDDELLGLMDRRGEARHDVFGLRRVG